MKKICGFIAVIFMLSILLTGCKSGSDTKNKNTDTSATHTDDQSITDVSESIYGTLTDEYYINEWLGLFLDLSGNDMSICIQPGTIDAYWTSPECNIENAVLDMSVKKQADMDNYFIDIYISDAVNTTLDDIFSEAVKAEETQQEIRRKEGYKVSMTTSHQYDFCGDNYSMLNIKEYRGQFTDADGVIYSEDKVNRWDLYRIKGGKLILLECFAPQKCEDITDILNCFKSTNQMSNINDYKTSFSTPNYSNEQIGKIISNILAENKINQVFSTTYGMAIDRLFKDYTWTFKPLPGYDYLYVATFTGTYYGHMTSYNNLHEDEIEYGSLSLLVDIRERDELKNSKQISVFYDNNDETKEIMYCINLIVHTYIP